MTLFHYQRRVLLFLALLRRARIVFLNHGGWLFTPQRAFEGASFQYRRHAHSWASSWTKCVATISRPLCRGTRCCCATRGCRTSTARARERRRHRRRREARNPFEGVQVLNGIHYHFCFGETRRVRVFLSGKFSDSTICGILEKRHGAGVPNCDCLISTQARADRHHD